MKRLQGAILPLAMLVFWGIGSELGLFNTYIVPAPSKVFGAGMDLLEKGILLRHAGTSLYRVFAGFSIAFGAAFPLAVLVGLNKGAYNCLTPALEFVRHIPPIAMIPLLILWFGIGETSKLAVIVLATFFPIFINTASGIANCDEKLVEVGEIFGFSRGETFIRIILPQAMPSVLAGMRLGLGYSWRSLMGAELIAASSGIGYMIMEAEQLSRIDIIFVGILVIGALGYGIDFVFFKMTARFLNWEGKSGERYKNQEPDKEILA